MFDTVSLIPAYGRAYTSKKELLKDWYEGKDFKIVRGPYLSSKNAQALIDEGKNTIKFFLTPAQTKHFSYDIREALA